MRKSFLLLLLFAICISATSGNFHSFRVKDIDGKEVGLSQFKGKKVLVVNVASLCGLTPEYKKLQELYLKYKDKGFVIVAFPANNFKEQEPGSNDEIKSFCSREYQVTFPLMSKISVKGDDIAPLYRWLTNKTENGKFDAVVKWNFQKFFIDEKGNLVGFMEPSRDADYAKIERWIETGVYN